MAAPTLEKATNRVVVRYKLGDMLFEIVRRHYDNRRISRTHMVALGHDHRYWQLANACLLAIGIRDAAKHSAWNSKGSSSKTMRHIGSCLRVDEETGLIECKGPDGTWVTVDLYECHYLGT